MEKRSKYLAACPLPGSPGYKLAYHVMQPGQMTLSAFMEGLQQEIPGSLQGITGRSSRADSMQSMSPYHGLPGRL